MNISVYKYILNIKNQIFTNYKKYVIISILFLFFANSLQSQNLKVSANTDKKDVLVGDFVELTISATWDSKEECIFPSILDTLGKWDVVSKSDIEKQEVGGQKAGTQKIIIAAYDSAYFTIPSLYFKLKNKTTFTDSFQVLVKTVPIDTSKQIMPIADIIQVPKKWYDNLIYILPVIVLGLFLLLYFYYKNNKNNVPKQDKPKEKELPAHEKALLALNKLQEKQLWQNGDNKAYHIELTDILRIYIEDRFNVAAMELTTDELMKEFNKNVKKYSEPKQSLKKILLLADMVKFAKMTPSPSDNESAYLRARQFIIDTKLEVVQEEILDKNKKGGKK